MASKKRVSMAESEMMAIGSLEEAPLDDAIMGNIEALQKSILGVGNVKSDGVKEIAISLIRPFKNHPFKVVENEDMEKLVESIRDAGKIYTPLLLRSVGPNIYECISGHRRLFAAKKVGFTKVPALIVEMTDDEAVIAMVDSNMQREVILPSERAFSLKMKMDALNHQGKKLNVPGEGDSMTEIGDKENMGRAQVHRYIRLTYLIPEFLEMVDSGKLPFLSGVELSYLNSHMQTLVNQYMGKYGMLKLDQLSLLRPYRESDDATFETLIALFIKPTPVPKNKVTLSEKKLYKYFPPHYTASEMEKVILELLEKWKEENTN